jgi:hypothetical protein
MQWFMFSLDGGGFLACDAPKNDFFRNTMPDHLTKQYHLLFLLSLYQRFTLTSLVDHVATNWPVKIDQPGQNKQLEAEKIFGQIRDRLLAFTARGYFAQVMQRENHHRCYLKWQEVFQVRRLYQDASNSILYMHQYLEAKRDEKLQKLEEEQRKQNENLDQKLNLIAWIFVVPALLLTFVQTIGPASVTIAGVALFGGIFLGLFVFLLIRYFSKRNL